MKQKTIIVQNSGFAYDVMSHGLVLCSFPTKHQALKRAEELAYEFGLRFLGLV